MFGLLPSIFAGVRGPGRMPSREDSQAVFRTIGEPGEDDPGDDFPWASAYI